MDSMLHLVGRGLTAAQFRYDDETPENRSQRDVVATARPATGVRRTRLRLAHALHRAGDRVAPAF